MSLNGGRLPTPVAPQRAFSNPAPDPEETRTTANGAPRPAVAATPARPELYRQHLMAARHFADDARALEELHPGLPDDGVRSRHRSLVIGAIITAAAFLEASINDLRRELEASRPVGAPPARPPRLPRSPLGERPRVLRRYQVALLQADAERFDERRGPYRDADALLKLRDVLVHTCPDDDSEQARLAELEERLRPVFADCRYAEPAAAWFPDRCLGAGCAAWVVRAAESFSDEFCRRVSIPFRGPGAGEAI